MAIRNILVAAVAAILMTSGAKLQAESADGQVRAENFQIEEIVVTARKKVEDLQSVPIAIEALTREALEEKAIDTIRDVAKYSSSLIFEVGVLPNDTRPAIRGTNSSRGRPNVAVLVDGVDISSETMTTAGGGTFANLGLLDLERVEVVKGPQSATYGRSAFAGALNYITRRPDPDEGLSGYIEGEADEHGYIRGVVNGGMSIGASSAVALTLLSSDFDGYYKNPNTGGDLGGLEQQGMAVAFSYDDGGEFSAYLRTEYADESYTPRAVVGRSSLNNLSGPRDPFLLGSIAEGAMNLAIPGGSRGLPQATQQQCGAALPFSYLVGMPPACASMLVGDMSDADESDIDQSPNPATGEDFNGTEIENLRVSLELDWQVGALQILSLTGYTDHSSRVEEDFDLTNFDLQSLGPGSANFNPLYTFADVTAFPPNLTPLGNNPLAAQTQFGVNINSDTSFDYTQFSHELRVLGETEKLEWMVDILFWSEDLDTLQNQMWWARETMDVDYWNSLLSRQVDPTCTLPGQVRSCQFFSGVETEMVPLRIDLTRDTEHLSAAASFGYHFTESLRGTIEGRYLDESIVYTGVPLDVFINGFLKIPYFDLATFSSVPALQKEVVQETAFVPRASLDWQVSDQLFVYASAGKGFKPGGIATTDANGDIRTGHYKPEILWAYEAGFKTNFLDNRLRFNGAVFLNDYQDQQIPIFVRDSVGVTKVSVTNAGNSEIIGFELEALYRPTINWTLLLAWTHAETELESFNISDLGAPSVYDKVQSGNVLGDFSGKQFTNTPEDVLVFAVRFDAELRSGMSYFAELGGNYQSKRFLDQGNLSYLDEVTILEMSAGIRSDNWRVTAYVDNLTDEDKVQSGLGNVSFGFMPIGQVAPFRANLTLPTPRTFGVRARYMF